MPGWSSTAATSSARAHSAEHAWSNPAVSAVVDAFVAALPAAEAAATRADPQLADALADALRRGRDAHPEIAVPDAAVAGYLAGHADDDRPPSAWLPTRNLPDVYLACAIARGVPAAVAVFEARFAPDLRAAARRVLGDADGAAEVVAAVREKLVVGLDARGPRIADYGGHGELAVWIRVVAVRAALDELRRTRKLTVVDDQLWVLASPTADPALVLAQRESAALIKAAFHDGLAALTARQRNLLRQHLIDGLTIDELGALYRVHRVTAARWLTTARADLWAHARRQLRTSLGETDSAIRRLVDELRSTLDLSIERALR